MPGEVTQRDPAIAELEKALMPAFDVIHSREIRLTDATRVFRRTIIRQMVKKTGNEHRASLRLALSHSWLGRVNREGEGADPTPLAKPKKKARPSVEPITRENAQ